MSGRPSEGRDFVSVPFSLTIGQWLGGIKTFTPHY